MRAPRPADTPGLEADRRRRLAGLVAQHPAGEDSGLQQNAGIGGWSAALQELRRQDGPSYGDTSLNRYVGQRVACDGMIVDYLLKQGYTVPELQDLHEHRSLLVARDAALWRQQLLL